MTGFKSFVNTLGAVQSPVQGLKLVCLALPNESKVLLRVYVNANCQVGILEVQFDHEFVWI